MESSRYPSFLGTEFVFTSPVITATPSSPHYVLGVDTVDNIKIDIPQVPQFYRLQDIYGYSAPWEITRQFDVINRNFSTLQGFLTQILIFLEKNTGRTIDEELLIELDKRLKDLEKDTVTVEEYEKIKEKISDPYSSKKFTQLDIEFPEK